MIETKGLKRDWGGSLLPVVMAVAAILFVGFVAETKNRILELQVRRADASLLLEGLRTEVQQLAEQQTDTLQRISGALSLSAMPSDRRFDELAAPLVDGPGPLLALGVAWGDGPLRVQARDPAMDLQFRRALEAARRNTPDDGAIEVSGIPTMTIWAPLRTLGGRGTGPQRLGQAVAAIDVGALLTNAPSTSAGLQWALREGRDTRPGPDRLLVGDAAVFDQHPVTTTIVMPGTAWTLAAVPAGGWHPNSGAWPIRLFTVIAAGLVALPMLRSRRLTLERQRHIRTLEDRESELEQLSHRLHLALHASQVAVWDYNIETGELFWDTRMDELYDMPADGRPRDYCNWKARLHVDDRRRAETEFAEAIHDSGEYRSDFRIVVSDGSIRHIHSIGRVYRRRDGSANIVGVNWDVTEDVIQAREVDDRRQEAEAAAAAKSQFLATISHEIRTPMNGIAGMLDLVLRAPLDPEQRDRVAMARSSAEDLRHILDDVLDFSKLEAGRLSLALREVDVAELARQVMTLMTPLGEERGLDIALEVDGALPASLLCDPTRLRQVIVNLVANAVKFTDQGGVTMRIAYHPEAGGTLAVAVEDTGVGISEDARKDLFDRFVQASDRPDDRRGGTGLGLAISKQLVELMGGEIGLESEVGTGTTFWFRIPAPSAAPAAPVEPGEEVRQAAPAVAAPGSRGARILVAEDNATNQKVLVAFLGLGGHTVDLVGDGAAAVSAAAEGGHDLIILDIQMPKMDGDTAVRRIRALDGPVARLPILALSANALAEDQERYLAAGFDMVLSKPITVEELLGAVGTALADRAAA